MEHIVRDHTYKLYEIGVRTSKVNIFKRSRAGIERDGDSQRAEAGRRPRGGSELLRHPGM